MKKKFIATVDEIEHSLIVDDHGLDNGIYSIILDEHLYKVDAHTMPSQIISALIDNKSYDLDLDENEKSDDPLDGHIAVRVRGRVVRLEIFEERRKKMKDAVKTVLLHHHHVIKSPMSGKIIRYLVNEGDKVKKGQGLVIVEAMKMENELQALADGVVKIIHCQLNSSVNSGSTIITLD